MILVLGSANDVLTREVCRRLGARQVPVRFFDEVTLFTTVPFAFERDGREFRGTLDNGGVELQFTEVSAVLVRLPRSWWPSEFHFKDQTFIYHETTAAWFCLLSNLFCRMVNRFSLGWWLNDLTYVESLRWQLAVELGLEKNSGFSQPNRGDLAVTASGTCYSAISVYVVGAHLIASSAEHEPVVSFLAQRENAVSNWQDETGIRLCRLDFEQQDEEPVNLKHVDVFPMLEREDAGVAQQVSAATAELLS